MTRRSNQVTLASTMSAIRVVGIAVFLHAFCGFAIADSIQIRREIVLDKDEIRLGDVAALSGAEVESFDSIVIGKLSGADASITVDDIRKALTSRNVNWSRVTVRGFESCRVSRPQVQKPLAEAPRERRRPDSPGASKAPAGTLIANPVEEVKPESRETLRLRLMTWLEQATGAPAGDFRVDCTQRDAALLDAAAQLGKVSFTTASSDLIGRVPLTIQQYEGEKPGRITRLTITIARRKLVVTAVKPVNRGESITPDHVEIREVFIDRGGDAPATKLDDVIGRQAVSAIRQGAVIAAGDLVATALVRRNDMVFVKIVSGGLVIDMEARALEDGALDQPIKVRNERSKDVFTGKVVRAGLVIVTDALAPENERVSDSPAGAKLNKRK